MSDAEERVDDGLRTMHRLFPLSEIVTGRGLSAAPDRRRFAVLPSPAHPRLLVPASPRGAAAAACRAYGGRLSRRGRAGYRALAAALTPMGTTMLPRACSIGDSEAGIDDYLGAQLGRPVSVAVHLTPARANRKPIVAALAASERAPVAFAKVATTPLTHRLLAAECDALRFLASQPALPLRAPEILAAAEWNDVFVLTMHALPTWRHGRLPTPVEMTAAAVALGGIAATESVLSDSAYLTQLREAAEDITDPVARDRFKLALDRADRDWGGVIVRTGASHGDWSPWNMWRTRDQLLVWDWERFATDRALGSDVVHYHLQELLNVRRLGRPEAARAVVASAPAFLRGVVDDDATARLVAVLHLLSLTARYETEGMAATGSPLGRTTEWLLPAVESALRAGLRGDTA